MVRLTKGQAMHGFCHAYATLGCLLEGAELPSLASDWQKPGHYQIFLEGSEAQGPGSDHQTEDLSKELLGHEGMVDGKTCC